MTIELSCTWIGVLIILIGSIGNWLCICVFFRKRFRSSILTPFFIALLVADCIYFTFRVIKLLFYQQTLFENIVSQSSCAQSLLLRIYGYFTQYAPQIFIPLCHYEFYIRFSLLLMSFLATQRAYDMFHSSYRMIPRNSSPRSFSYLLILCAFILAYLFEFFGLNIFCSSELSSKIAYQWYNYIRTNLSNETTQLISFMKNESNNQSEIDCIINNATICSREQTIQIVRHYFDMHERPIVYLIQRIQVSTMGARMARNELRLKYHYHTCPIRFEPNFFLQIYNLLYSRLLGVNRYTSILVLGSIIPSIITILANAVSLRWIITIRGSFNQQSRLSRRRTDETRRVIIIITTECILAIINSWFVDIILSIKYCGHSVVIGDDCPHFLRRSHALLALSDLLNSMSNIVLYSFAGRRFRHELKRMLNAWILAIKKRIPCYCRIEWKRSIQLARKYDDDQCIAHSESSTKQSKPPNYPYEPKHEYIKLRVITYPTSVV
ncbi:unnamed protein product [Rotaria sp. Silwood1]|nr:unnamed protein product [Rotaria sp. Silwood1]CAF0843508.1 unnamed protein product [Rotaria sp. Silwood1]CAF3364579.1 unnamed protein product [Rotaria sp. Silwood1]CAF3369097.1 unnamed protein product [Rotaria sp. Silwood1]CAF3401482.1 unnamed protein product [Rotaria sp. Silwood1]